MFVNFYELINDTIKQYEEEIEAVETTKFSKESGIQYARLDGMLDGLNIGLERLNTLYDIFMQEYDALSKGTPKNLDEETEILENPED